MTSATATVMTENASRYLQQLCKHWGHKFAVEFTPTDGLIPLGDGRQVSLKANPTQLVVTVDSPDEALLPRLQDVVEEHIARFVFREQLVFRWLPIVM